MTPKSQIIDVYEHTQNLRHILTSGLSEHGFDSDLVTSFSDKFSVNYVLFKLDDLLNARLQWAKDGDVAFKWFLDWFGSHFNLPQISSSNAKVSSEAMDVIIQLLDPIDVILGELIDNVVDDDDWGEWHMKNIGTTVFFEYCGDYRINVFEALLAKGEIKL